MADSSQLPRRIVKVSYGCYAQPKQEDGKVEDGKGEVRSANDGVGWKEITDLLASV